MKIINIPDISPPDDDFTRIDLGGKIEWVRLTGLPRNPFERQFKPLNLSRYRGALEAAMAAKSDDIVISHLPRMTAAASIALRLLGKEARHLAFSFNFTALPTGSRQKYMNYAFKNVEHFAVFSEFEVGLYAKKFDLDPLGFSNILWSQEAPEICDDWQVNASDPYFCAIGGEGRDIDLIVGAAKKISNKIKFIVITRPNNIPNYSLPDNVYVLTNIPASQTWKIASESLAVLIPLEKIDTCCGHITIVSSKLLGIPIVTTDSLATNEYLFGRPSILKSPPKEVFDFVINLEKMIEEQEWFKAQAKSAIEREKTIHSRQNWRLFLDKFLKQ